MLARTALLLAVAIAAACPGLASARTQRSMRWSSAPLPWNKLPAPEDANLCCFSQSCSVDHHCMQGQCNVPASQCASDYNCKNCECCPCCGKGQHCVQGASSPGPQTGVCCEVGYEGADCKTPICDKVDCGSHGKCSAPNTCTCDAGWSGTTCTVPVCEGGCGHGKCTAPATCSCDAGWSGKQCTTAICTQGCVHGNCTGPNTCQCAPNWMGTNCSTPECTPPCSAHGTCSGPNQCVCTSGWEGPTCSQCISDKWAYDAQDAAFNFSDVSLLGCFWGAGLNATVTATGTTDKMITAGTIMWHLYEDGVTHFVSHGNSPYFWCNNKGCDPTRPIALKLQDPTASRTNWTITFPFQMVPKQATGDFRLVAYGQDQDHSPYDFNLIVSYNYTASAELGTQW